MYKGAHELNHSSWCPDFFSSLVEEAASPDGRSQASSQDPGLPCSPDPLYLCICTYIYIYIVYLFIFYLFIHILYM